MGKQVPRREYTLVFQGAAGDEEMDGVVVKVRPPTVREALENIDLSWLHDGSLPAAEHATRLAGLYEVFSTRLLEWNLEDGGVPGMQGATVVDGTWFVTTSRGRYRLGSVWVGRPGDLCEHRWQLPVGPEDITYWSERDQLWSLSEYPGARYVYAMPRSRFLRETR